MLENLLSYEKCIKINPGNNTIQTNLNNPTNILISGFKRVFVTNYMHIYFDKKIIYIQESLCYYEKELVNLLGDKFGANITLRNSFEFPNVIDQVMTNCLLN